MQLWAMLSLPPTNHLAKGRSHSRVVWKSSIQSMRSGASRAQNASGSASASAYRSALALACAVNAGSGGNLRSSARRFSISGVGVGDESMLTGGTLSERSAGRAIVPRPTARPRDPAPLPGRSVGVDGQVVVSWSALELAGGQAGRGEGGGVAREDHALGSRDLDAVRFQRHEKALAEIATG